MSSTNVERPGSGSKGKDNPNDSANRLAELRAYFSSCDSVSIREPSTLKDSSLSTVSKTVTVNPPNKNGDGSGGGDTDANNPPNGQDGSSSTGGNTAGGSGGHGPSGSNGSGGADGSGGNGGDGRDPKKPPTDPNAYTDDEADDEEENEEDRADRLFIDTLFSIGAHARPNNDDDNSSSDSSSSNGDNRRPNRSNRSHLSRSLTDALRTFRQSRRPTQVSHNANVSVGASNVRPYNRHLFKDLPDFTGDYLDFPEFFELFLRSVDRTDLPTSYKLIYLKKRLDSNTLKLIKTYTARDYSKALERIVNKFTGLTSVMQHIRECLYKLPHIKHPYDLDSLTELTEHLRSIQTLFELYKLDRGFEMEVFCHFYDRFPDWMTDKYMRRLDNRIPKLKQFLKVLDYQIGNLNTKTLYKLEDRFVDSVRDSFKANFPSDQFPDDRDDDSFPDQFDDDQNFNSFSGSFRYDPSDELVPDQSRDDEECDPSDQFFGGQTSDHFSDHSCDEQDYNCSTDQFCDDQALDAYDDHYHNDQSADFPSDSFNGQSSFRNQVYHTADHSNSSTRAQYSSSNYPRSSADRQQGNHVNQHSKLSQGNAHYKGRQGSSSNQNNNLSQNQTEADPNQLSPPCTHCDQSTHSLLHCHYLTPKERMQIAKEHRMCLICLEKTHQTFKCRSFRFCENCGGAHTPLLCSCYGNKANKIRKPNRFLTRNGNVGNILIENESETESEYNDHFLQDMYSDSQQLY